ncbi:sensor histidine kinase [Actinocorallia populi]|uniref:sensor histidine kinase n=1 Tax=Actinocorallia populi TaxID=2079200 RepID=UPI000D08772E|nr:histidine kinase [Actinocorallia populi]
MSIIGIPRDRSLRRKDVLPAAGLFVLGAALCATGWESLLWDASASAPWEVSAPWRLVPLAGACAAVLVRRIMPLPALGAGLLCGMADLLMGFSIPMLLALWELLHSAALHASKAVNRLLVRTIVVLMAAVTVLLLVTAQDRQIAVLVFLLMLDLLFVPVWWATAVRQERETADAERLRAEQQAVIAELDRRSAVAEERARMARDLHDVIAGHLSAIALQSGAVDPEQDERELVDDVLRAIRQNSVEALREMRAMIELLRSQDPLEHRISDVAPSRLADLDLLLDSARAAGLRVAMAAGDGEAPPPDLPAAVDLTAYRIVQEALTNAVKHAAGARSWVRVFPDGDDLHVEVVNELARGGEPALSGGGTGLLNMRERAAAIKGTVTARPEGGRWRVHAVLPLGEKRERHG